MLPPRAATNRLDRLLAQLDAEHRLLVSLLRQGYTLRDAEKAVSTRGPNGVPRRLAPPHATT